MQWGNLCTTLVMQKSTISHRVNEIVLNAQSQKEPKGINETHLFTRNSRSQRGESVRAEMDVTCVADGISGRVLCLGGGAA